MLMADAGDGGHMHARRERDVDPPGYVGGWILYATGCGHPLYYANTQLRCQMAWHDLGFDQDHESAARLPAADTRVSPRTTTSRHCAAATCRVTPDPAR